jgi:TonB family protein
MEQQRAFGVYVIKVIGILLVGMMPVAGATIYNTYVEKEYSPVAPLTGTLVIVPLTSTIVDYSGNVKDEFGEGDYKLLIRRHFNEMIIAKMREMSRFTSVAFDSFARPPRMSEKKFTIRRRKHISIVLPDETEPIRFKTSTPDFILFVQNLHIGTETDPAPAFAMGSMSGYGTSDRYLRYECEFAFWDNQKNRVVAYGRAKARSSGEIYMGGMFQAVTSENWRDVDDQLVRILLGKTPFYKKPEKKKDQASDLCDSWSSMQNDTFQHNAFHSLRSNAVLQTKAIQLINYFKPYLANHDELFIKADKCTLSLEILPNGKLRSAFYKDTLGIDSSTYLPARQELAGIQFDSIPGYLFSLRLFITATKTSKEMQLDSNLSPVYLYPPLGRSRESIMQVVMQNLAHLRYIYNARLRMKSGIKGKITVKFAINEHGQVVFCNVVNSTANDPELEEKVAAKIRTWQFCPIHRPGDVTEVVYPFVFSQ